LLLFGKHPQSYLSQSKIKADAFQGTEPGNTINQQEIMGTIFDLVKGAMDLQFIEKRGSGRATHYVLKE